MCDAKQNRQMTKPFTAERKRLIYCLYPVVMVKDREKWKSGFHIGHGRKRCVCDREKAEQSGVGLNEME